ncbi:MAG: NAD(P)-dependent alcohol dehydrogenase [Myxococcales bacterium]|nr:NAD(P)-dependent alcohol dehydrogenase [Myxococcales bacterium]
MQAAIHTRYGAPSVLTVADVPTPAPRAGELRLKVAASAVTQGDAWIRGGDFPGVGWLPGRLMMGLFKPKQRVPGTTFSGTVEAVGPGVQAFAVGDRVFGLAEHGAHAERLVVKADAPMARLPQGLSLQDAAVLPYGALTALHFLTQIGRVQAGERVLVVGAAGEVGRAAVQLAQHLGAVVTGVCRPSQFAEVRALGAAHVIDRDGPPLARRGARYDIIFDTAGVCGFCDVRRALAPRGRFMTLHLGVGVLVQMALTKLFGRRRALFGLALGSAAQVAELAGLWAAGAVRPRVAHRLPLTAIAEAHARRAARGLTGSVLVTP